MHKETRAEGKHEGIDEEWKRTFGQNTLDDELHKE